MQISPAFLLSVGLASAVLPGPPMRVHAADAPLIAAALQRPEQKTAQQSSQSLDLRAPPIESVMTQAQIAEVLARTFAPRDIEEVEVGGSRVRDPDSEDYIPPGFASLFWASGHPSGLMRLFMPQQNRPARAIVDATRQAGPPPAIPAMAGEIHHYDR